MSNHVTITGNLGQDPELRFIASGKAVCTISVGDTPRRFNKDTNKWEDAGETLWLRCSIWVTQPRRWQSMDGMARQWSPSSAASSPRTPGDEGRREADRHRVRRRSC